MTIKLKKLFLTLFFLSQVGVALVISLVALAVFWWLTSEIQLLEIQNKALLQNNEDPVISEAVDTVCVTFDIAIVCMGRGNNLLIPMLKSLLHHRQNPLHFHIVVNSRTQRGIRQLFERWDVPDVKYTCYNAEDRVSEIDWVPNTHYSGVFGLMKLLFPDILPISLKKVIVLDSDLIFLCDIAELWNMFGNITDDKLIGLVENESNWYNVSDARWPALGRGYNMGVILLDLDKIRRNIDWTRLWYDAVIDNIDKLKETKLGEQDIINTVIKSYPNLVYNISCLYNIQLSVDSIAKQCYGDDIKNVKIIHWNSPQKHHIRINDSHFFENKFLSYANLDFHLLKVKRNCLSIA